MLAARGRYDAQLLVACVSDSSFAPLQPLIVCRLLRTAFSSYTVYDFLRCVTDVPSCGCRQGFLHGINSLWPGFSARFLANAPSSQLLVVHPRGKPHTHLQVCVTAYLSAYTRDKLPQNFFFVVSQKEQRLQIGDTQRRPT